MRRLLLLLVGISVSVTLVFVSLSAMAEANDMLLASLGQVAIQVDGDPSGCRSSMDIGILNPYIFQLQAQDVFVDKGRYPRAREITLECADPTVDLALILGYCNYVQRTGNLSVLMIYTRFLFDNSFVLLDAIKSISTAGQQFDPGIPVLVWESHDTIDYTDCSCGSREYHIFAVPMPEEFLSVLKRAQPEVRIVMAPHPIYRAGTDDTYAFRNDTDLKNYINFINGL